MKMVSAAGAGARTAMKMDVSGESMRGWKTIIGIILIQAAHQLDAIADMLRVLPGNEHLLMIQGVLTTILPILEKALELFGSGAFATGSLMVVLGVAAKAWKFVRGAVGFFL